MRRILGVAAAALGAAFAAFIVSEYEFVGVTPWAAAFAIGLLVGEVIAAVGRWRGATAMVAAAAIAIAALLWGEWLESDSGVEPYSTIAYPAALLAAAVAAWNVREPAARTSSGS